MNPYPDDRAGSTPSMARHQMTDAQHQGMVVATFEHPHDWRAQSEVRWNLENLAAPVWAYATTFAPDGAEAVEFLAPEGFYWLLNSAFNAMGQSKYGMVCMPPMPAGEAMTRLVIPKYRGTIGNARLGGATPIPNLAEVLGDTALANLPTESVGVQMEYEREGRSFQEEWYGVKTQQQAGGGAGVQVNWGFARLFCFRAERGRLDAARPTLWHIARSVQPNPQWQALYNDTVQALNAQHGAAIEGGRVKLQGEAEFQGQLNTYYQEQRDRQNADVSAKTASDRARHETAEPVLSAQERWRNELGGEEAFLDPDSHEGNVLYQRSGDVIEWINELGERKGSEDPTYDPNIGSTHTWRRLRQA
ncbi:MAG: hypothetical protein WKF43_00945 [Acidimicrobiales bacterium]